VVIYDSVEQKITSGDALGEDAVSFVFESNPGSYYYAMAEGVSERGTYELLVKEE